MPLFLVDNRTQNLLFFRLVHRITKKKRWVKAAVVDQRVEVQDRRDQVDQERKELEAQRPQKRRPTTVQTS
ncbi:unnamed protein product [Peronospora farinosa]|uniref:Uncharacterized protein n=1 Tax=Peronospora farinosa TaxID=134698 RepID=A0ABN8CCR2_9STRA|nr:unnamed protein product [Peronospora farinosa]